MREYSLPRYLRRKGSRRKDDSLLPAVCLRKIHIPKITVSAALFNLIYTGHIGKYHKLVTSETGDDTVFGKVLFKHIGKLGQKAVPDVVSVFRSIKCAP